MKLVFATHNNNKLDEVKDLLSDSFEIFSLKDIGFFEEIISLMAPGSCASPFGSYSFTTCSWENLNTTIVSGLLTASPSPETIYCCLWKHQDTENNPPKSWIIIKLSSL